MTQPSNVRFVMEDRLSNDLNAFRDEINSDQDAFEASVNSKISKIIRPNGIINGAFDIWQRGTSFNIGTSWTFTADRWAWQTNATASSKTVTRVQVANTRYIFSTSDGFDAETFQPQYFMRYSQSGVTDNGTYLQATTRIEDVRSYSTDEIAQPLMLSWQLPPLSNGMSSVQFIQNFGTGGSPEVVTTVTPDIINFTNDLSGSSDTLRFRGRYLTVTLPDVGGKTIGPNSYLGIVFNFYPGGGNAQLSNVKIEFGLNPSNFVRAGGTLAGELSACQRYYYRIQPDATGRRYANGQVTSTTAGQFLINFPQTMRVNPTALEQSGTAAHYQILNAAGTAVNASAVPTFTNASQQAATISVASTYTAAGQASLLLTNNTAGFLGFSAELI
jgi:hypothetical protein